jgi:uncharacterized iron-regulated membrane protein
MNLRGDLWVIKAVTNIVNAVFVKYMTVLCRSGLYLCRRQEKCVWCVSCESKITARYFVSLSHAVFSLTILIVIILWP